ncbi:MAG: aldehyde dehydrogenase family protein, partial [Chloroflexaceae bacterium]|nr:aldehyde dehydrogenase family protein [Chloroflexaceae bacterium]
MSEPSVYKNFIGGEWVASQSGKTYARPNPADTREIVGVFQDSDGRDVAAAVAAAQAAYRTWRLVPAPKRAEILYRAAQLLMQRKAKASHDMTREMGKVLAETGGDVQEA